MTELPHSEVTPAVRQTCEDLLAQWRSGTLPFAEAQKRLAVLRETAQQNALPADQGYTELMEGIMHGWRGNYAASIDHFEAARSFFAQVNNRELVVRCMLNIGESQRQNGSFTRARQYFHMTNAAARDIGHIPMQVVSRSNEAQMLITLKNYGQAFKALEDCFALRDRDWSVWGLTDDRKDDIYAEIAVAAATIALEQGTFDEAWRYALEALDTSQRIGVPLRLGMAHRMIGEILTVDEAGRRADMPDDPDEFFQRAVKAFREVNADGEIAKTLMAQGRSLAKRGIRNSAARKLQQAMVIFTKLGMVNDAAEAADLQLKLS